MSVGNIIDRRKESQYNVYVDVVFEPSWHDNSCENATAFEQLENTFDIDGMNDITIEDAVKKCDDWDLPVTLYLYDKGSDPMGIIGEGESFVDTMTITSIKNDGK